MLNNIKTLRNLFSISFAILGGGLLIRYNVDSMVSFINYINMESLLKWNEYSESKIIQIYGSIQTLLGGLLLAIFGFRINKLEKTINKRKKNEND